MTQIDIRDIVELGISEREAKLYVVMLEYDEVNANDLHRLTGVQRSKMYSILSRMVVHGLCTERIEGRNRFFTALSPKTVKDTLVREWDTVHSNKLEKADILFEKLADSFQSTSSGPSLNSVEMIRNAANIHNRYLQLVSESQSEILGYMRPPFAATTKRSQKLQLEVQIKALERGVVQRGIFSLKHLGGFDFAWKSLGEQDQMRVAENLPLKMFIFDRSIALVGMPTSAENNNSSYYMLNIEDTGFVQILVDSFEGVWQRAIPVENFRGTEVNSNSPQL
ncbi:MAG: hypothetical protein HQ556_02655 [Candidatus Marinimicrobia bacterium]|nr:hypothetical protein [Candidatus Neomarinimicrobiota bacterium]